MCLCHFYKGKQFLSLSVCLLDKPTLMEQGLLLTLLHSEWPKLHRVLAVLSAIGLKERISSLLLGDPVNWTQC